MKEHVSQISPVNLAYIGDAVFELHVRTKVLAEGNAPADKLFRKARAFVNAGAQSQMYHKLLPLLSENELSVLKRGRNAKTQSKAKNASMGDYRHATGLESLLGYLYLAGETERLNELLELCTTKGDADGQTP